MPLAYDPVKAHEYYIRTRKLKGRKSGSGKPGSFTVTSASGKTRTLSAKELSEQRAYAAKRVGEIKKKLADLSSALTKAMSEAIKKKAKSEREAAKPKTAAEKAEAARESEKFREKHKTEIATKRKTASKKTSTKADPVAVLEGKIAEIKVSLKAAVAKQRALASATRNS